MKVKQNLSFYAEEDFLSPSSLSSPLLCTGNFSKPSLLVTILQGGVLVRACQILPPHCFHGETEAPRI